MVAGGTATTQTETLTNTGNAVLNVGAITITGTNASDFSETNTCGASLAAGANCTVTLSFSAATAGTYTATLAIVNNASVGGSATVSLTGTATAPAVPQASMGAASLTFSSMAAGGTSAAQTIQLTNTGGAALTLSGIVLSGSGANFYRETNTCGTTLAAGANCTISTSFAPKVTGSYTATLTVTDNANGTAGSTQTVGVSGTATPFAIAINNTNATDWKIDNGAITLDWNSTTGNVFGMMLDGTSDQLVDITTLSSNGQPDGLYSGDTGFDTGTLSGATYTIGAGGAYLDWSVTDVSSATNAYTSTKHWIVYPNDPGLHTYIVLSHSTSDIAGGVGQVQWIFRDSQSLFTNTYEVNPSLNSLGVTTMQLPVNSEMFSTDPGRYVQDATNDLHGFTDLPASFTRRFYTKYDHAGYEYLHQAHGLFGTTYGVWTVLPRLDTLVGGPTKQDLYFTGNIDMIEAYSDHEDNPMTLNTAAGTASTRLFGPYYIHFNLFGPAYNSTANLLQTPADMYADAVQAGGVFSSLYDSETQLLAAGYVPTTGRGTVSLQINGVSGGTHTAWAVLSDPAKNFQVSSAGYQYWADISANGSVTITGVVPGTYRLSVYVLGQWGELREDNIVVQAGQTTIVPTVSFVPENFGSGPTPVVFTMGTPDRSAHEFLHGHMANGNDDREYWGAWNYWADFAANSGAAIYNATSGPAGAATNDLTKWSYIHWGKFDPGLFGGVYQSSDDTTDGYNYAVPAYVAGLTGASGTNGVGTSLPAWQIHFATPATQTGSTAQAYVVLSVAVACTEGSYVVSLNGNQEIWHYTNASDCMIRSGLSGYTQWFAMQWPASALKGVGADNTITISMSQTDGSSDDALRLELSNSGANPATTGWNDYEYIYGPGVSQYTLNNDAIANP